MLARPIRAGLVINACPTAFEAGLMKFVALLMQHLPKISGYKLHFTPPTGNAADCTPLFHPYGILFIGIYILSNISSL